MERTIHCGESCGNQILPCEDGSKIKMSHVNMLKTYIAREPGVQWMWYPQLTDLRAIAKAKGFMKLGEELP